MGEPATKLSYTEYLAFEEASDEKHEFVDGIVFAMAGGSLEHARLAARVTVALSNALSGRRCNVFGSDARVRISATRRATYPDISVVCGPVVPASDDPQAIANPIVLVEVLSPTTEQSDRGEKFRHYRRLESLREYVLVAQDEPRIEVFRREGDVWTFREHGPGERVMLTSIDAYLDVDAIYADPAS